MGRKHNVEEAIRSLSNKHDIKIDVNKKTIYIKPDFIYSQGQKISNPDKHNDLGNKSWGKIDYLVNHNGYTLQR